MTVANILSLKGDDVITLPSNCTVGDLIDLLAKKRIGVVVIVDSARKIEGILSERDVVKAISGKGAEALEQKVSFFMTRSVSHCQKTDTVNAVMERMSDGRFRHMPVVEDGKLAGLISIGDVVKSKLHQAEKDAEEMRAYISAI